MGKQRTRGGKKRSSAVRPGPSTRGNQSSARAPATLPSTPSVSGAPGLGHITSNPARLRPDGKLKLQKPEDCREVVDWLAASASTSASTFTSQSTSGQAVGVEHLAHSEELFSHQITVDQTLPMQFLAEEILCPDTQPFNDQMMDEEDHHAGDGLGAVLVDPRVHSTNLDDDETQITEDARLSEEESDDPAGDDEVLDPNYNPENMSHATTLSSDADEEMELRRMSTPVQQVSAFPQTTTVPTAVTPTLRPITVPASVGRGKGRTSPAWFFFEKVPNSPTEVRCNICHNKYSRGKNPLNLSTTAMTRHMVQKHAIEWQNHTRTNAATARGSTSTSNPLLVALHAARSPTTPATEMSNVCGPVPQSPARSTDSASVCNISQQSTQLSVQHLWAMKFPWAANNTKVKALNKSLAKLLAIEMLPYSIVDTESFQSFVSLACPRYKVPSRHFFANSAVPALQQHVLDNIMDSLKQSVSNKVHFTTDTWTSKHGQGRYLTLTGHWVNLVMPTPEGNSNKMRVVVSPRFSSQSCRPNRSASASSTSTLASTTVIGGNQINSDCRGQRRQAVLHLRSLGDRSHTGEQLWAALSQDFARWLTPLNLEPGYVVCDNASNLLSALRLGHLTHVPCLAHVLNLAVQKFLKGYPGLKSLLIRVRKVCAHFHRSPLSSNRLLLLQKTLGLPGNRVICDVATRWNSTFQMIKRFCQLKRAVVEFAISHRLGQLSADDVHFSPSEWEQLHHICTVLASFQHATEMVSGDKALISISVPVVFLLEQTLVALRTEVHSIQESEEEEFTYDDEEMLQVRQDSTLDGHRQHVRRGESATVGTAPTQSSGEETASAIAEEVVEGQDLHPNVLSRGWPEEEEEETVDLPTLSPNVDRHIGVRGSVSHMSAFMLHYLQHDKRIFNIKTSDHYWLATILDPRYKSRVADMLPQEGRAERMQQLQNKLVQSILQAFPGPNNPDVTARRSTATWPEGSGRQASTSSNNSHSSGSTDKFCTVWTNFFRPAMMQDASSHLTEAHPGRIKNMVAEYMAINFQAIPNVVNPFDFWVSKMDLWPELSKYALEILSCPAASVLSERVFSSAGNILTDNRNRLSTTSLDRLTQIKMNRSWISDDYELPIADSED